MYIYAIRQRKCILQVLFIMPAAHFKYILNGECIYESGAMNDWLRGNPELNLYGLSDDDDLVLLYSTSTKMQVVSTHLPDDLANAYAHQPVIVKKRVEFTSFDTSPSDRLKYA